MKYTIYIIAFFHFLVTVQSFFIVCYHDASYVDAVLCEMHAKKSPDLLESVDADHVCGWRHVRGQKYSLVC